MRLLLLAVRMVLVQFSAHLATSTLSVLPIVSLTVFLLIQPNAVPFAVRLSGIFCSAENRNLK